MSNAITASDQTDPKPRKGKMRTAKNEQCFVHMERKKMHASRAITK